ncbi:hypothetical protein GA0115246_101931 [Streptomyces sp. SolWspMP-sol7th]|nr:hypothetical protein GA0115246_101931 [Streptomyces sp. SolWspMP-sol7th]
MPYGACGVVGQGGACGVVGQGGGCQAGKGT